METVADPLSTVHPEVAARMRRVYQDVKTHLGLDMRATCGLRSMIDQKTLWQVGRDSDDREVGKIVTRARPGSSLHNFGLAVDSRFFGPDPYWETLQKTEPLEAQRRWSEFCRFVRVHGMESGEDFPIIDRPHAQMRFGLCLKGIQDLYKLGGIESVWKRIDQIIGGI